MAGTFKTSPQPQSIKLGAASDGLQVQLRFDPNGSIADGKTPDTAIAKVTSGLYLLPDEQVRFTINGGTAVFTDPDADTQGKQATRQTNPLGRATANFTDTTAENTQTMTATVNPDSSNSASDTETFIFTGAPHNYALVLNKIADGQQAGGGWTDEGRAVVTDNGGKLAEPVTVNFVFTNQTSAQFLLTGDDNIQEGSTSTSLLVKTHYRDGKGDIADASFTDANPESVTVEARLKSDTNVNDSKTFSFQGTTPQYALVLNKITDGQQAGGGWTDEGRAVVTDNGGKLTEPVTVNFVFTNQTSAQFVLTGDDNIQEGSTSTSLLVKTHYRDGKGDIADASFTDANAESVAVKAVLQADTTVSDSKTFSFVGSATDN